MDNGIDLLNKHTKNADRPKSHAANFSAADRVKQYWSELREDSGKLFCRTCNVVLLHEHNFTVDDHLTFKA